MSDDEDIVARVEAALAKARFQAGNEAPYLCHLLYAVEYRASTGVPTIGVDQWGRGYFNAEWVDRQDAAVLPTLLIHEVNHLIRQHAKRCGARHLRVWNRAADLEINDDLQQPLILKAGGVTPHLLNMPNGLLGEDYYERLLKGGAQGGAGSSSGDGKGHADCGSCVGGPPRPWEGQTPTPESDASHPSISPQRLEGLLAQVEGAMREAKSRGLLPGGYDDWIQGREEPKAPWRTLLRRWLGKGVQQAQGLVDYTYRKPSRREWGDFIMPSLIGYKTNVAIVVDTSGSMGQQELAQARGEVEGICRALNADATVLEVDAAVQAQGSARDWARKGAVHGRGGTDMAHGIEEALKLDPEPAVIVVLTDGYTGWPEKPVSKPVVACIVAPIHSDFSGFYSVPKWIKEVRIG